MNRHLSSSCLKISNKLKTGPPFAPIKEFRSAKHSWAKILGSQTQLQFGQP